MAAPDRRHQLRFGTRFDVRFTRATDAARALNAYSVNFSAGGLCLRTRSEYLIGEHLTLDLQIEGQHFTLNAAVAWVRNDTIGVRFTNVAPEDRARLEAVARLLESRSTHPPA